MGTASTLLITSPPAQPYDTANRPGKREKPKPALRSPEPPAGAAGRGGAGEIATGTERQRQRDKPAVKKPSLAGKNGEPGPENRAGRAMAPLHARLGEPAAGKRHDYRAGGPGGKPGRETPTENGKRPNTPRLGGRAGRGGGRAARPEAPARGPKWPTRAAYHSLLGGRANSPGGPSKRPRVPPGHGGRDPGAPGRGDGERPSGPGAPPKGGRAPGRIQASGNARLPVLRTTT